MVTSSLKGVVSERQATWPSPPEGHTHSPPWARTSRSASSSQPQWRTAATRGSVNDSPRLTRPRGLTMLDQVSRSSTKRRDTRPAQPGLSHIHTRTHGPQAHRQPATRPARRDTHINHKWTPARPAHDTAPAQRPHTTQTKLIAPAGKRYRGGGVRLGTPRWPPAVTSCGGRGAASIGPP